jgi:acyl-coenzyme A synthetase/AMP-(fatty) acid ligase
MTMGILHVRGNRQRTISSRSRLLQTGAVSFPISTRNSALAVAHLLRSTNTHQVFVSDDAMMRSLFSETAKQLAQDDFAVQALDIPQFEHLYNNEAAPAPGDVRLWSFNFDSEAVILHSSGTSSFPKPIRILHRGFFSLGSVTCKSTVLGVLAPLMTIDCRFWWTGCLRDSQCAARCAHVPWVVSLFLKRVSKLW